MDNHGPYLRCIQRNTGVKNITDHSQEEQVVIWGGQSISSVRDRGLSHGTGGDKEQLWVGTDAENEYVTARSGPGEGGRGGKHRIHTLKTVSQAQARNTGWEHVPRGQQSASYMEGGVDSYNANVHLPKRGKRAGGWGWTSIKEKVSICYKQTISRERGTGQYDLSKQRKEREK